MHRSCTVTARSVFEVSWFGGTIVPVLLTGEIRYKEEYRGNPSFLKYLKSVWDSYCRNIVGPLSVRLVSKPDFGRLRFSFEAFFFIWIALI